MSLQLNRHRDKLARWRPRPRYLAPESQEAVPQAQVGCSPPTSFICCSELFSAVAPSSLAARFLATSSAAFLARRSRVFLEGWMPWKLRKGKGRAEGRVELCCGSSVRCQVNRIGRTAK